MIVGGNWLLVCRHTGHRVGDERDHVTIRLLMAPVSHDAFAMAVDNTGGKLMAAPDFVPRWPGWSWWALNAFADFASPCSTKIRIQPALYDHMLAISRFIARRRSLPTGH